MKFSTHRVMQNKPYCIQGQDLGAFSSAHLSFLVVPVVNQKTLSCWDTRLNTYHALQENLSIPNWLINFGTTNVLLQSYKGLSELKQLNTQISRVKFLLFLQGYGCQSLDLFVPSHGCSLVLVALAVQGFYEQPYQHFLNQFEPDRHHQTSPSSNVLLLDQPAKESMKLPVNSSSRRTVSFVEVLEEQGGQLNKYTHETTSLKRPQLYFVHKKMGNKCKQETGNGGS